MPNSKSQSKFATQDKNQEQNKQQQSSLDPEIQAVVSAFSQLPHEKQDVCIEAMTAVYVAKATDGVSERDLLNKISNGFSVGLKFLDANVETRDKGSQTKSSSKSEHQESDSRETKSQEKATASSGKS